MLSKYLKALYCPIQSPTQPTPITHPLPAPTSPPPRTRLMSVSYCKAEPELAVTTPARRNMPCSSSSFLIPRTWESSVCRSRSWRYFSFEPQMKSRSLRTWRRTNGVCWIIRYLREKTQSQWPWNCTCTSHSSLGFRELLLETGEKYKPSYFLVTKLAPGEFLCSLLGPGERQRKKERSQEGKTAIFRLLTSRNT